MALMDLIKQIISGLAFGLVIFGILFMVFGYFGILTQITKHHKKNAENYQAECQT